MYVFVYVRVNLSLRVYVYTDTYTYIHAYTHRNREGGRKTESKWSSEWHKILTAQSGWGVYSVLCPILMFIFQM